MELYLVRHTTPDIEKGICYGQSDIGVADTFASEVKKIHESIPLQQITKIYSSPLQRCALLAKTFEKPVIYDNRLLELNFGDWELKPWDTIPRQESQPWMDDFVHIRVPNGESYIMLQQRVLAFFSGLKTINTTNPLVIVSHAGPLRAFLSTVQQISLQDSFSISVAYGQVIKITY